MRHAFDERCALVRNHVGHVRPQKHITEEQARHDGHRQTDNATRSLKQQSDPRYRHNQIERRWLPGAHGQFLVKQEQIRRTECRNNPQNPVRQRNICSWRTLERGKQHVPQEQGKRQMNRTNLRVVEDEDSKGKRQRRRYPKLEQRPEHCHADDEFGHHTRGSPTARIRLGDHLPNLFVANLQRFIVCCSICHGRLHAKVR